MEPNSPLELSRPSTTFGNISKGFGRGLNISQHTAVHSRRMGYLIGELLLTHGSPAALGYIGSTIQPADADGGEPIPLADQSAWNKLHLADFTRIGWRMDQIIVTMPAITNRALQPSFHFRILASPAGDTRTLFDSPTNPRAATTTTWNTAFILLNGQTAFLDAHEFVGNDLGGYWVSAATQPASDLPADPIHGVNWSASIKWTSVHY